MKQTKFAKALALCLGVLVFSGAISYLIFAWTAPASTPPGDNVDAPINTGPTAQTKQGSIGWGTTGANLNTDQGASVELRGTGTPYIDFSNDNISDYDARIILTNNDLLAVSGADLNATDRLCIKGDCRAAWPDGGSISDIDCTEGGTKVGWVEKIEDGMPICNDSSDIITISPCASPVGTGIYRVFVTAAPYSGANVTDPATADALCQAAGADLGGTFKALVNTISDKGLSERDPSTVLSATGIFVNGEKTSPLSTNCIWHTVAESYGDFFDLEDNDGDGIYTYLKSPIKYDQGGNEQNGEVWTNIKPDGSGAWTVLSTALVPNTCSCGGSYPVRKTYGTSVCAWRYYCNRSMPDQGCQCYCTEAEAWYGISSEKGEGWAYNRYYYKVGNQTADDQCLAPSRRLYCVEQ